MSGHVFVIRGDLTLLSCDAWLLPTDDAFHVTGLWRDALASRFGTIREQPAWGDGERARKFIDEPGRPQVWLGRIGATDAPPAWYVDGAEAFVRGAAMESGPWTDRPPLLAINHLGTGKGGAAFTKGDLLAQLFDRLVPLVEELDVDVAVVSFDGAAHAAAQRARLHALTGMSNEALGVAAGRWQFETPERTRNLVDQAFRLAGHIEKSRLALFIGAGVSAGAGLPGWGELLRRLGRSVAPPLTDDEFRRLHDDRDRAALLEKRFAAEGRSLGREVAAELGHARYSLQHGLLAGMKINEITTTNFDELFESAARAGDRQLAVMPGEAVDEQGRWLLKLHGTLSRPDELVFTRSSFLEAPRRWGALFGLVQAMLMTRHMLFVGYGLADEDFHDLVHEVRYAQPESLRSDRLGSAVTLFDDPLRSELWKGDLGVIAMRSAPQGGEATQADVVAAGRDVERFLDLIGMLAADRSAFLLDPEYRGMLTNSERSLAQALEPLARAVAASDLRDGWSSVAALLASLGRRGISTSLTQAESEEVEVVGPESQTRLGDLIPGLEHLGGDPWIDPRMHRVAGRLHASDASWADVARLQVGDVLRVPYMGPGRTARLIDYLRQRVELEVEQRAAEGAAARRTSDECAQLLLSEFHGRDLDILRRVLGNTGDVETLEEIGHRHGITRERVRQLEVVVRKRLTQRLASPDMARLRERASALRTHTGAARPIADVEAELQPDSATLADELFGYAAGPYVLREGWLVLPELGSPSEVIWAAFSAVSDQGLARLDAVREELEETEVDPELLDSLVHSHRRLRVLGESIVDWSGSMGDIAVRLVRLANQPTTIDELVQAIQPDSLPSLRNQLSAQPDLIRVGLGRWALTEWGADRYEGIVPAMIRRLTESGITPIDALATELNEQYGVSKASVSIFAQTHPLFIREGVNVRLRRVDEPYVPTSKLDDAPDCVQIDGQWAFKCVVDNDVLRGSGGRLPEAFAVHLGLQPLGQADAQTAHGPIGLSWRHQPIHGTIRGVVRSLGGELGDIAWLIATGPFRLEVRIEKPGKLGEFVGAPAVQRNQERLDSDEPAMTESEVLGGQDLPRGRVSGATALKAMTSVFDEWQITCPRVPLHIQPKLRGDGIFIATDGIDLDPLAGYGLELGGGRTGSRPRSLRDYISEASEDYFVAGGRDNGYSSHWGFVSRAGGVLAAVQVTVGDFQRDPRPLASLTFAAFNEFLAPIMERGPRPLSVAVLFSSYRGLAELLVRDDPEGEAPPSADEELIPWGWNLMLSRSQDGDETGKVKSTKPDAFNLPEVQAAHRFLQAIDQSDG